jgi:hypothetical protein
MQNERYVRVKEIATILALGLVLVLSASVQIPVQTTSATTVDRALFCNLDAYPDDTVIENITLYGDLPDRTGSWRVFYKHVEGDSGEMNITSWIEVTPNEYTIKDGEAKYFQLIINVPSDAAPGLWGAISEDAAIQGHVDQRRTYIEFTDGDADAAKAGGVATRTGIRIPVSVNVLGTPEKPSPFEGFTDMLKSNILSIAMLAVIVVLLVILLRRRKE